MADTSSTSATSKGPWGRVVDGRIFETTTLAPGKATFHGSLTWVDLSATPDAKQGWTWDGTKASPPSDAASVDHLKANAKAIRNEMLSADRTYDLGGIQIVSDAGASSLAFFASAAVVATADATTTRSYVKAGVATVLDAAEILAANKDVSGRADVIHKAYADALAAITAGTVKTFEDVASLLAQA